MTVFQSTLPTRGATRIFARETIFKGVSIHAPHTGSDDVTLSVREGYGLFQSTLPTRGATIS